MLQIANVVKYKYKLHNCNIIHICILYIYNDMSPASYNSHDVCRYYGKLMLNVQKQTLN